MKRKEFKEFYKIGLEISQKGSYPSVLNVDCEEIDGNGCPHEYAFYFAKQCVVDMATRNQSDWSKMPWLRWALFYRVPSLIAGLFEKKPKK